MEKVRVIIQRHKKNYLPNVIFLSETDKADELFAGVSADFDDVFNAPVGEFVLASCELVADMVIEAKNWPDDFPTGYHLMHDPRLMVYLQREGEIDELEQQWNPEDQ